MNKTPMHFEADCKEMAGLLKRIKSLTDKKTSMAVTHCVLLEATEGRLKIRATDLETSYSGEIAAQVRSPGKVLLTARMLLSIVATATQSSFEVYAQDPSTPAIRVQVGATKYELYEMPPEDFPGEIDFDATDTPYTEFSAGVLRSAIQKMLSVPGVAGDHRAHVAGVLLQAEPEQDGLRLVATDASRLVTMVVAHKGQQQVHFDKAIAAKDGLAVAANFMKEADVRIAKVNSQLVFRTLSEVLSIRLLEGSFPDIADLVAKCLTAPKMVFAKAPLVASLLKLQCMLGQDINSVVLYQNPDKAAELVLNVQNPHCGEGIDYVPMTDENAELYAAAMQGQHASFNLRYLLDALECIDTDDVRLHLDGHTQPLGVTGSGEHDGFGAIVMPMRL